MANENRINQPWKELLEEAAALPGEGLPDKAAAWQELHHRLQLQPRRKRVIWYWVAAACLLLAMIIPFAYLQNNRNNFVLHAPPKKAIHRLPKQLPPPNVTSVITVRVAVASSTKREAIKIKTKDSNRNVAVNDNSGLVINHIEEYSGTNLLPPTVDSAATSAIVTVQPKKQLKVVHVNELGDPVLESSALVHNTEPHSFELQIGKEEVVANAAVSLNKSRFPAITFKTSPTN